MLPNELFTVNKKSFDHLVALEGERKISYQELSVLTEFMLSKISALITQKKQPYVLLFNNNIEYVVSFLAAIHFGPVMPMNPGLPVESIEDIVSSLSPAMIIHDSANANKAQALASRMGLKVYEAKLDALLSETTGNHASDEIINPPVANDVALILHTSGTTAKPKCVPLTYANLKASIQNITKTLKLDETDRNLNMMPLFHIHGIVASMLSTLSSGGTLILKETDFEGFTHQLQSDKPTWYTAVPTIHHKIYHSLIKQPQINKLHLRFIRSCSSPLSEVLQQSIQKLLNIPVVQAYGMTEAAHQVTTNSVVQGGKLNSVGTTNEIISVRIIGEKNEILSTGEVGEVCIRGTNVFQGYLNNPKANEESFVDGYFRTGDLGFLDADGYLFLTGRKKEMINKGGFKITPLQIDQQLLKHPLIKEAITFPIPHETLGDDIAVMIVGDKRLSEEIIYTYLGDKLADYMLPGKIYFVDEIPKSATGKINRLSLAKSLPKTTSGSQRPQTQLEQELVDAWQNILSLQKIHTDDNFFDLGGNSLSASQFYNYVLIHYEIYLEPIDIYKAPTVTKMAELITHRQRFTPNDWLTNIEHVVKKYEEQVHKT